MNQSNSAPKQPNPSLSPLPSRRWLVLRPPPPLVPAACAFPPSPRSSADVAASSAATAGHHWCLQCLVAAAAASAIRAHPGLLYPAILASAAVEVCPLPPPYTSPLPFPPPLLPIPASSAAHADRRHHHGVPRSAYPPRRGRSPPPSDYARLGDRGTLPRETLNSTGKTTS
jgi:hypothetical protein